MKAAPGDAHIYLRTLFPRPSMIRFRLFGSVDLRRADGAEVLSVLAQPKRCALLAYFAISSHRGPVRRDTITALFWPDMEELRARHALAKSTHFLRKSLGDVVLVGRGDLELALNPQAMWTDVREFERALSEARWADAYELFARGELMEGFHLGELLELERWLEGERERFRRGAVRAVEKLAAERVTRGDVAEAAEWLRRRLALEPYSEPALRDVMEALVAAGDGAGALAELETFATRLALDLDGVPGPSTVALRNAIRDGAGGDPRGEPVEIVAVPDASERQGSRTAPRRRSARWWVPAVMAVAAAAWMGWASGGPRPAVIGGDQALSPVRQGSPERMVVLPLAFRGDIAPEWVDGLTDLLVWNLDGVAGLSVERGDRAGSGRLVLRGEAVGVGDSVRVRLVVDGGEGAPPNEPVMATGSVDGLLELADSLAVDVARTFLGAASEDFLASAAATTRSLPALRAFLDGERLFRAGQHSAARQAFEDAIRHDSTFALGFYRLAVAADWTGAPHDSVRAFIERAWALRASLPWRDALRLRGARAAGLGRLAEAESALVRLTELWPSDRDGWLELGEVLFHLNPPRGRPYGESEWAFTRLLELDSTAFETLAHLSRIAAASGDSARLGSILDRMLSLRPDHLETRVLRELSLGDVTTREAVLVEVASLRDPVALEAIVFRNATHLADPVRAVDLMSVVADGETGVLQERALLARAVLFASMGRYALADADLDRVAGVDPLSAAIHGLRILLERHDPPVAGRLGVYRRVFDSELSGEVPEAEAQAGLDVTRAQLAHYGLGLIEAREGNEAAALLRAEQLRGSPPFDPRAAGLIAALAGGIEADVLRRRGDPEAALRRMGSTTPEPSPEAAQRWLGSLGRERLLRARLLVEAGRPSEAVPLLRSFPDLSVENRLYEAPARQILDRILAKSGGEDGAAQTAGALRE